MEYEEYLYDTLKEMLNDTNTECLFENGLLKEYESVEPFHPEVLFDYYRSIMGNDELKHEDPQYNKVLKILNNNIKLSKYHDLIIDLMTNLEIDYSEIRVNSKNEFEMDMDYHTADHDEIKSMFSWKDDELNEEEKEFLNFEPKELFNEL